MICTGYNKHVTNLLDKQEILWKCILDDGTQVLSDFDLEGEKDPWTRLKIYCNNNQKDIVEVRVMCPGMPETTIYKDDNGLDQFFIIRGVFKDLTDDDAMVFKYMSFGKLEEDGKIHVSRFYWPEFNLIEASEVRNVTPENLELLYKKKKLCGDNCTCQKDEQT